MLLVLMLNRFVGDLWGEKRLTNYSVINAKLFSWTELPFIKDLPTGLAHTHCCLMNKHSYSYILLLLTLHRSLASLSSCFLSLRLWLTLIVCSRLRTRTHSYVLMRLYDNRCSHTHLLKASKANNFESFEAFARVKGPMFVWRRDARERDWGKKDTHMKSKMN